MKKLGILKIVMFLLFLWILSACSMEEKENNAVNEEPDLGIIDSEDESNENGLDPITIEKIEKYEGMEITDWIDEQTVILAKGNQELGKMGLLENAEFYPRSIYAYNLDTDEFKLIKAQEDMFLGGAILSPDKKHLLYYEYSIGDVAYYLKSLEDIEQSSVVEDNIGIALTADWADEQNVIGASYAGGAYLVDMKGHVNLIVELQEEQLLTAHKIQDKIYYITTDNPSFQVYMLDTRTREKKNLRLENANSIELSPDGKQILVTQATEFTKKLIITDADGNMLSAITEGTDVTGASWSPNQQMIAYQLNSVINGIDSSGLYLYDVLTDKSVQIANNVGNAKISWSPSGNKIAVTELNERIYTSSVIYIK